MFSFYSLNSDIRGIKESMAIQDPISLLINLTSNPAEQSWLEFKQNQESPEEIAKYVSALANAAMLSDRDRAYVIFGVEDATRELIGTKTRLEVKKKGGEDFHNWLTRVMKPQVLIEMKDFEYDGKNFSILAVEPSYHSPVKFKDEAYIRIGQNKKKLSNHPEHERALWMATGRRKFEDAIAKSGVSEADLFTLLDFDKYFELSELTIPSNDNEKIRKFIQLNYIKDDFQNSFEVTNLGAILFAKDISSFTSLRFKPVRFIQYDGIDKTSVSKEVTGSKGYAVGFAAMIKYIMDQIPNVETYIDGIRKSLPKFPEVAIREVLANAIIHQDFTQFGVSPVIEVYQNRVDVINPGNSLIETDRMIDERKSRNESLAASMRDLGMCEERGGGLDKAFLEIEKRGLPALDFNPSENSMRVTIFGPKEFKAMSKQEKLRSAFYHCVLCWLRQDFMSNESLRNRFGLEKEEYQIASAIISESKKAKRIKEANPNQSNKFARYVPYWV